MVVYDPKQKTVAQLTKLGIAIKVIARGFQHVGILYRPDGSPTRIWHLARHFDLKDEECNSTFFWAESGLDSHNQRAVAAWIISRRRDSDKIPYGFDSKGLAFDQTTGEFLPPPTGKGFTCATFIGGVFKHLGFTLLDEGTWAFRVDDVKWQNSYMKVLRKECKNKEHCDLVEADIGKTRIRPEEVAAGAISKTIPVDFRNAVALATEILRDLKAA